MTAVPKSPAIMTRILSVVMMTCISKMSHYANCCAGLTFTFVKNLRRHVACPDGQPCRGIYSGPIHICWGYESRDRPSSESMRSTAAPILEMYSTDSSTVPLTPVLSVSKDGIQLMSPSCSKSSISSGAEAPGSFSVLICAMVHPHQTSQPGIPSMTTDLYVISEATVTQQGALLKLCQHISALSSQRALRH